MQHGHLTNLDLIRSYFGTASAFGLKAISNIQDINQTISALTGFLGLFAAVLTLWLTIIKIKNEQDSEKD